MEQAAYEKDKLQWWLRLINFILKPDNDFNIYVNLSYVLDLTKAIEKCWYRISNLKGQQGGGWEDIRSQQRNVFARDQNIFYNFATIFLRHFGYTFHFKGTQM